MHVGIVSALPPGRGALAEYGYHLVEGLCRSSAVQRITVFADQAHEPEAIEHPKLNVIRCWCPDRITNNLSILSAIRKVKPDCVHFNVHVGYQFGRTRIAHALGFLTPTLVRLAGYPVILTLHDFVENIEDPLDIYEMKTLNRVAARWLTRFVGMSSTKIVLLTPRHERLFREAYGIRKTEVIPHGVFETQVKTDLIGTDKSEGGREVEKILVFGRLGKNKAIDLVYTAFRKAQSKWNGKVELVISTGAHPANPNLAINTRRQMADLPSVTLLDYIPEQDLPKWCHVVRFLVLPYLATTGVSGVYHAVARYGTPVVAFDLGEFKELQEQGAGIYLVPFLDAEELADAMLRLLQEDDLIEELARANRSFADSRSFSRTIEAYADLYWRTVTGNA